jgi:hypothetical protein
VKHHVLNWCVVEALDHPDHEDAKEAQEHEQKVVQEEQ